MTNRISADYQRIIHTMKYSRGGRETWFDSVNRYVDHLESHGKLTVNAYHYLNSTVAPLLLKKSVVPSMRLMATAGPAAEAENLMGFNCMFMGIKAWDDFGKLMYALMCGTGVGFSLERVYTDQLEIPSDKPMIFGHEVIFEDSREGWALGFNLLIQNWIRGYSPKWDLSNIRPKGSPLVTTGGYASGPEPLEDLLQFSKEYFLDMYNMLSLNSEILYDICCKIADVVVQGGVRRSATICLFDYDDPWMWTVKTPQALEYSPWRYNSNNSVVFPDAEVARRFLPKVLKLARETGEPGVVVKSTIQERLKDTLRNPKGNHGINPCGEIILRDNQVCNLTEVVCRPSDSLEDLMDKVEAAVFLGILQSRFTKFHPMFHKELTVNTEEERLLGVSLTGLMDDPELTVGGHALDWLREYARESALKWTKDLGLPMPMAITCVKPSGTVSKLVDSSAGVHPRFSRYYLSNIGVATGTPLEKFLRTQGVPIRTIQGQSTIFSFPMESPAAAITADTLTAIDQLTRWKTVNDNWCDHNASCTIYVSPQEWPLVEQWCLQNAESLAGVTFLSRFEATPGSYMPLEKLTEEEYLRLSAEFPVIHWQDFHGDTTLVGTREYACTGGSCELL